jgi:hypothetical protein
MLISSDVVTISMRDGDGLSHLFIFLPQNGKELSFKSKHHRKDIFGSVVVSGNWLGGGFAQLS